MALAGASSSPTINHERWSLRDSSTVSIADAGFPRRRGVPGQW
jgi:hypothetical protein